MKKKILEKNISKFSSDSKKFGGYIYTSTGKLSSLLANKHITDITVELVNINGKKVFDVGCGDGTYTMAVNTKGKPKSIYAIDPAINAIKAARNNNKNKNISFDVGNIYKLPKTVKYDVAIIRGVLHHLYKAPEAIKEVSKIAKKIIIIEPNGYNPLLKIIEKTSKYHIEHEEKSYPPFIIDRWIKNNQGKIIKRKYAGLVPFFCSDSVALFLKKIEPLIESLPIINMIACANYYIVYEIEAN